MAYLSSETIQEIFHLQNQLLELIHQATALELAILEQFGETEATIPELDEIVNIKERIISYYTRLNRLLLQIYQSQPVANSATLNLLAQSISQTRAISDAGKANIREIKRNWNLQ